MPRIIVKCRYIKNAAAHRSNLISYMGKREGVDKNIDADHPTTNKQEEMIARLLRSAPDATDTFEYEDYIANPTAKNASEFIELALEQNADQFADRKIFLEYIANRPRVQKMGSHGLFSDTDDPINLSQVQQEVAEHPGNVWTNIVSLRREDAARLGYDNAVAYFGMMVRNSYKNEFRANDNFFNHISSVGDETDIQQEFEGEKPQEQNADFIERQLCEASVENWLLFMENERLHKALVNLLPAQVTFLYELAAFDFDQTKYAAAKGVSKQAVSDRFQRISRKIRNFF